MPTTEPPLVDVKVTNPVTYLRRWWDKVMGKEGIDFRFTIHPITAVLITATIVAVSFGAGRYSINIPFLNYQFLNYQLVGFESPKPTSTATPKEEWKETAFTGTLHFSQTTNKYFLQVTSSSEAIILKIPANIDLSDLVGKRILAFGSYNKTQRLLIVSDTKSLEVLPKSPVPIPTFEPTTTVIPTLVGTPRPEITPEIPPAID